MSLFGEGVSYTGPKGSFVPSKSKKFSWSARQTFGFSILVMALVAITLSIVLQAEYSGLITLLWVGVAVFSVLGVFACWIWDRYNYLVRSTTAHLELLDLVLMLLLGLGLGYIVAVVDVLHDVSGNYQSGLVSFRPSRGLVLLFFIVISWAISVFFRILPTALILQVIHYVSVPKERRLVTFEGLALVSALIEPIAIFIFISRVNLSLAFVSSLVFLIVNIAEVFWIRTKGILPCFVMRWALFFVWIMIVIL
jgi:hypothetical protein